MSLHTIPRELLLEICEFLDPIDLIVLGCVCKYTSQLAGETSACWQRHLSSILSSGCVRKEDADVILHLCNKARVSFKSAVFFTRYVFLPPNERRRSYKRPYAVWLHHNPTISASEAIEAISMASKSSFVYSSWKALRIGNNLIGSGQGKGIVFEGYFKACSEVANALTTFDKRIVATIEPTCIVVESDHDYASIWQRAIDDVRAAKEEEAHSNTVACMLS